MLATETPIDFLLRYSGFEDLRSKYDYKQLIATATQINPQWLEHVAGTFQKFRGWKSYNPGRIIDLVYGLDYIIDVDTTAERIGFCFTTNPDLVEGEIEKAQNYSSLWKSLGVTKVMIVLCVYPVEKGFAFYDRDKSQDNMYGVIMDAVESNLEIISAEVQIEFDKSAGQ